MIELPMLTKRDFASDQTVRWCPGCGDYAILSAVQKTFPKLGYPKEKFVIISGIGCSSRFPYYMDTYGFHTIHGRAPAIATGLKTARPDLSVWVVTGDGDGLSIGGNHLVHAMRRNVDLNILLFNNRIYGLTKGQYSPTSEIGKVTKSSPFGSIDRPINPLSIAIAAEATFLARTSDSNQAHLQMVLERAARHEGTAFVEILQNCIVFNNGAWTDFTDRTVRDDHTVMLEHGKPLIFGANGDKGIRVRAGLVPEVVKLGDGISEHELLVHDERFPEPSLAYFLTRLTHPDFPVPMGVFRDVREPTYNELMDQQIAAARERFGEGDLMKTIYGAETWEVQG